MSVTQLRTSATRRTLRDLFRRRESRQPGAHRSGDHTPTRQVPAPRYEALAIGLGCDHLGRHGARRR